MVSWTHQTRGSRDFASQSTRLQLFNTEQWKLQIRLFTFTEVKFWQVLFFSFLKYYVTIVIFKNTYWYIIICRNRGAPMHLKISNREGKYILGINSRPYDTIPEMIHHYSMHMLNIKGAEHVKLQYPVFQENMYFTVEPGS